MLGDSSNTAPAHARKPWGIIAGTLIAGLALMAPYFLLEPILAPILPAIALSTNVKIAIVTLFALGLSMMIIAAALAAYKKHFSDIGFTKPTLLHAAKALVAFVVYVALTVSVTMIARALFNLDTEEPQELGYNSLGSTELIFAFISLVIFTPIVEEMIFRGFLYTGFRRHLPFLAAALGVSALFG